MKWWHRKINKNNPENIAENNLLAENEELKRQLAEKEELINVLVDGFNEANKEYCFASDCKQINQPIRPKKYHLSDLVEYIESIGGEFKGSRRELAEGCWPIKTPSTRTIADLLLEMVNSEIAIVKDHGRGGVKVVLYTYNPLRAALKVIADREDLDFKEALTLIAIASLADNKTWQATPTCREVMQITKYTSKNTFAGAIKGLVSKGLIASKPRTDDHGGRLGNQYTLLFR